tara:strand:+ start:888 stop:1442 length:555 start_codon:yes stop_codon:yes gene_type:complete
MLISAFFAAIIPLCLWLYQKATDTESPEKEKLNITIFGVLFIILSIWDIGDSLSTYINYFEKYGDTKYAQKLATNFAKKLFLYGIVVIPICWSYKTTIKNTIFKIFKRIENITEYGSSSYKTFKTNSENTRNSNPKRNKKSSYKTNTKDKNSKKEELKEYKQLFDEGLISEEEYKALKKKALDL